MIIILNNMKRITLTLIFLNVFFFGYSQKRHLGTRINKDSACYTIEYDSSKFKICNISGILKIIRNDSNFIEISQSGNVTFEKDISYNLVHGHSSFSDSARQVLTVTQNNYYHITNTGNNLFTVNEASNVIFRNDSGIIQIPGDYVFFYGFTISGSNGDDYRIRLTKNGNPITPSFTGTGSGALNFLNLSNCIYLQGLVAGDKLCIEVGNISNNNNNPTFRDGFIYIKKEHD